MDVDSLNKYLPIRKITASKNLKDRESSIFVHMQTIFFGVNYNMQKRTQKSNINPHINEKY